MTTGRRLRLGETLFAAGIIALGLFITVETARMTVGPAHAMVGPRLFPILVAIGLVLVGFALLREAVRGAIAPEGGMELDGRAIALVAGGLILQVLLIERAGWMIGATVLFVCATAGFGSRRLAVDAALGLGLGALAFVSFNYGLGLELPTGEIVEWLLAPAAREAP